jgi:hypothetical protein
MNQVPVVWGILAWHIGEEFLARDLLCNGAAAPYRLAPVKTGKPALIGENGAAEKTRTSTPFNTATLPQVVKNQALAVPDWKSVRKRSISASPILDAQDIFRARSRQQQQGFDSIP